MLTAAIESVLAQTFAPVELIVVSDVSDDATKSVVAAADARAPFPVRLVQNLDQPGASGSRNAGARGATGELLAFLDDDDLWAPEHVETGVVLLAESGAQIAVAGIEVFNETSRAPGIQLNEGVTAREAAVRAHGVTGSNIVVRSADFWRVGGFDPQLRHLNDRDFFYRSMLGGLSYAVSPRLTARYRKHDAGQLSGASEGRAKGVAAYLTKHRGTLTLADRRQLRYQIAVMRYRSSTSARRRAIWLGSAAANVSLTHVRELLGRAKEAPAALSGRAFESDARQR